MNEAVLVAIISGCITLLGTVITCVTTSNKNMYQIKANQQITDSKLNEIDVTVKEMHKSVGEIPVIQEKINSVNHRIDGLEKKVG